MKISIVTPNLNGMPYLESTIESIAYQRQCGVDLEYIIVDGGSTDGSLELLESKPQIIDRVINLPASGPAAAINAGFAAATGDIVAWMNSDDFYASDSLSRVVDTFETQPELAMVFGHCPIINETGDEIRKFITGFKKFFYPLSSRFTFQTINYISQPATFYSRHACQEAGPLREDMKAAFDYEFFLRLWRTGSVKRLNGNPLAYFRWHENSISAVNFETQFSEELSVAGDDAGHFSLQYILHTFVRWGIVTSYNIMARGGNRRKLCI